MTLVDMTKEEKEERKKQQRREAQHKYYIANKEKYKEYARRHSESQFKKLKKDYADLKVDNINLTCENKRLEFSIKAVKGRLKDVLNVTILQTIFIVIFSMYMMIISACKIFVENKVALGVFMLICWTITMLLQTRLALKINKELKEV